MRGAVPPVFLCVFMLCLGTNLLSTLPDLHWAATARESAVQVGLLPRTDLRLEVLNLANVQLCHVIA